MHIVDFLSQDWIANTHVHDFARRFEYNLNCGFGTKKEWCNLQDMAIKVRPIGEKGNARQYFVRWKKPKLDVCVHFADGSNRQEMKGALQEMQRLLLVRLGHDISWHATSSIWCYV
jgi:hypothetical protein